MGLIISDLEMNRPAPLRPRSDIAAAAHFQFRIDHDQYYN